MADVMWLKSIFADGYSSGDILGIDVHDKEGTEIRLLEERKIGGSYREFFKRGVMPHLSASSKVIELGPGRGSWTRALFSVTPRGEIHTIDIQDVRPWLDDLFRQDRARIFTHQVPADRGVEFDFLEERYFDLFFSFGVFCHLDLEDIEKTLVKLRPKLKRDAVCIAQYSDWEKGLAFLDSPGNIEILQNEYAQIKECFPFEIEMMRNASLLKKARLLWEKYVMGKYPDSGDKQRNLIWTKNDQANMMRILRRAGYHVLEIDMGFFQRDSVALFRPNS